MADREIIVTYDGYSIGGSTGRHPVNKFRVDKQTAGQDRKDGSGSFEVEFIVSATSVGAFNTACIAAEAAFIVPHGALTVSLGGTTIVSWDGSTTSLNNKASISKVGSPADTALSRLYRARVDVQLPAATGTSYLARQSTELSLADPNLRKEMSISGEYTRGGGATARANYESGIGALETAQLSALSLTTSRLDRETASSDATNNNLSFSRVYRELYTDYLLRSSINVEYGGGRRRVLTISGVYLSTAASGGTGSLANYDAGKDAYVSTIQTALGGTWRKASEKAIKDDNDRRTDFVLVYDELLSGMTQGPITATGVSQQSMSAVRVKVAPGDSAFGPPVARMATFSMSFSCFLDKTVITDIESFYVGTVRAFLVTYLKSSTKANVVCITKETVNYDEHERRLSCQLEVVAPPGGGLLEQTITTIDDDNKGVELVPIWNGDPLARYRYQRGRDFIRTVRIRRLQMENQAFKEPPSPENLLPGAPVGDFIHIRRRTVGEPTRLGVDFLGTQLDLIRDEYEDTYQLCRVVAGGKASSPVTGGSAPPGTRTNSPVFTSGGGTP